MDLRTWALPRACVTSVAIHRRGRFWTADGDRRMVAIAINVGANTSLPGRRGPIHPEGSFTYVPIPERCPTAVPVPTYADLDLGGLVPHDAVETPIHLDPTFAEYRGCVDYTYGDEHWVKARPLADLRAGDHLYFYATLSPSAPPRREWIAPEWGAYLIGHFELSHPPIEDPAANGLSDVEHTRFRHNAHVKRETLDARVLLAGDPERSRLYDRAIPLSSPDDGATPNRLVTELSKDSGRGPWWRRPLRFEDHHVLRREVEDVDGLAG